MNSYSLIVHSEMSQGSSAILKIYFIKSNLCNLHEFYSLIDVSEQADENFIIDQCLKFLESSSICLLTCNLIVFEQMKRFVFSVYFGFLAFLLGRDTIMWGHWWLYFDVHERL